MTSIIEEESFPRGGGEVLTAIEKRKIQEDARQAVKEGRDLEDFVGEDGKSVEKKDKGRKPKRVSKPNVVKKHDKKSSKKEAKQAVALSVSGKRLKVGCSMVGIVRSIQDYKATLSLPNGLMGTVEIHDVSPQYVEFLQKQADEESEDEESEEDESDDIPTFHKIFSIGQHLVCQLKSIGKAGGGHVQTHLSLDPALINKGLSRDDIVKKGRVTSACVKSCEENGYVVDFGVEEAIGFLDEKEATFLTAQLGVKRLTPGQPILVSQKAKSSQRAIKVKVEIGKEKYSDSNVNWDTVRAGQRVSAKVKAHTPTGLMVHFSGLDGFIHYMHIPDGKPNSEDEMKKAYPIKSALDARVIFVDNASKTMNISLLPQTVEFSTISVDESIVGTTVTTANVITVEEGVGLLLDIGDKGRGFVHISRVSDDSADKNPLKVFKNNTKDQTVRVISLQLMDNVNTLTMQESIINKTFLRYEDVSVGEKVTAVVISLEKYGALVKLTETIKGLIPSLHFADVKLNKPERRFVPGAKIKCRVMKNGVSSSGKRRLVLTAKKTLVNTPFTVVTSYESLKKDMFVHGFISSVREYGCIVSFFSDIRGLIPTNQLSSAERIEDPSEYFKEGQVVKCRVLTDNPKQGNLRLSLRLDSINNVERRAALGMLTVGLTTPAVVERVAPDGIDVKLSIKNVVVPTSKDVSKEDDVEEVKKTVEVVCTIPSMHLTDHVSLASNMHTIYKQGDTIAPLVVSIKGSAVVLSLKSSLMDQSKVKVPTSMNELKQGDKFFAYVSAVKKFGLFINLVGGLSGVCGIKNVAKRFISDIEELYQQQQTVYVSVLNVKDGKLDLMLKNAENENSVSLASKSFFTEYSSIATAQSTPTIAKRYACGSLLSVKVTNVASHGISCKDADGISGFIVKDQCNTDEDGEIENVSVGDEIEVVVLAFNGEKADLSSSKDLINKVKALTKANTPKKTRGKKGKMTTSSAIKVGERMDGQIELVKDDFSVLCTDSGALVFVLVKTFNERRDPFDRFHFADKRSMIISHTSPSNIAILDNILPLAQKVSSIEDATVGAIITVKVKFVHANQINFSFGNGGKGRVFMTEIDDDPAAKKHTAATRLAQYKQGQFIQCKVLGFKDVKMQNSLDIERPTSSKTVVEASLLKDSLENDEVETRSTVSNVSVGQKVRAVVTKVEEHKLWLAYNINITGIASILSEINENVTSFEEKYKEGDVVDVYIMSKTKSGKLVSFSFKDPSLFHVGGVLRASVIKITKLAVVVQIADGKKGSIHACDFADTFHKDPFKALSVGSVIDCVELSTTLVEEHKDICFSSRPSLIKMATENNPSSNSKKGKRKNEAVAPVDVRDKVINSSSDVEQEKIYRGYVNNVTNHGVFVALGRNVSARVQISHLSDMFIKDFESVFKRGQLVKGKVLHISDDGKIEFSLKKSVLDPSSGGNAEKVTFDSLEVGSVVTGNVKRVESFGVFISISNSKLTGMAHISECSDIKIKDLKSVYFAGDDVKAVVIKLDKENHRISFGLKKSYFDDKDIAGEGDDEEEEVLDEPSAKKSKAAKTKVKKKKEEEEEHEEEDESEEDGEESESEEEDDDEEEEDEEEEEELDTNAIAEQSNIHVLRDDEEGDLEEGDDDDFDGVTGATDANLIDAGDKARLSGLKQAASVLQVEGGQLLWGNDDIDKGVSALMSGAQNDSDVEDESDTENDGQHPSKKAKRAAKKKHEETLREDEEERVGGVAPKTTFEFERTVLGMPNSSYVWIRYMAYYLQSDEIDKARDIAKRALSTISFREEKERMNVWVACLNLENAYGTDLALEKSFADACRQMDPLKMHNHLLVIYEKSNKHSEIEELFKSMCKKFNKMQKVWLRLAEYRFKQGRTKDARAVLERSLKSIDKIQHIDTIIKFAILEFKHGDVERARTMFDNVLSNYPKRVDLWSVWLDQEGRVDDVDATRQLFERVITLNLSVKKMKYFFKRYLAFEKENGDADTVQEVARKAKEFVESKFK
eukprot:m.116504 g.116504  ORF g.116504 m.116504 type:complete len:2001 (-) comp9307_c0_seq1:69-6071(-)